MKVKEDSKWADTPETIYGKNKPKRSDRRCQCDQSRQKINVDIPFYTFYVATLGAEISSNNYNVRWAQVSK